MPRPERPPYLPEVPLPSWPRLPDFVPAASTETQVNAAAVSDIPHAGMTSEAAAAAAVPALSQESAVPPAAAVEKDTRVVVRGRIATAPQYGTTPKGQARAFFHLAEHLDPETTTYHRVRLFGERVDKFRPALVRGSEVEVVGYAHPYEVTDAQGQTKRTTYINAIAIRK